MSNQPENIKGMRTKIKAQADHIRKLEKIIADSRTAPVPPAGDVEVLAMNKDCAICLALGDICVSCEEVEASAPPLGDVIVIGHVSYVGDGFVRVTLEGPSPGVQTELVDRAHVTRLTAERDGLQAAADKAMRSVVELATAMNRDVPDLSPKFELFETIWGIVGQIDNMYAGMRCERDALQSELTKALEELRLEKLVGASKHQQAEDFKALSWERGQELTKARECLKDLGVDWPQVSDLYQSAPAAKGGSDE